MHANIILPFKYFYLKADMCKPQREKAHYPWVEGPEPRTLNLSQHPSLYYAGKHKELSEAIGKEQLTIKIEKKAIFKLWNINTVYERGNEAILAWLSEGILELYRKISKTKEKDSDSFLIIPNKSNKCFMFSWQRCWY